MRRLRLCACLMILTALLVGCNDPSPAGNTTPSAVDYNANAYAEGVFTVCALLIDSSYLRYLVDRHKNLPPDAFHTYPEYVSGRPVGRLVGGLCKAAALKMGSTGP